MSADPTVNASVAQQVDAFPAWLLPLWANWPVVLLGMIGIGVLIVGLRSVTPILKNLQNLTSKMSNLNDQIAYYRRDTQDNLYGLRREIQQLNQRLSSVEENIHLAREPDSHRPRPP